MHIADGAIRQTHISSNHVNQCLVQAPGLADFQKFEMQTFLKNFGRLRRHATGTGTAHLGPVRFVHSECDQHIVVKYGQDNHDVREVCAAAFIGRVGDKHVAGLNVSGIGIVLQCALDGGIERRQKSGYPIALREQVALRVCRADGKICGLINDRTHACAKHGDEHLVANRYQGILDDL